MKTVLAGIFFLSLSLITRAQTPQAVWLKMRVIDNYLSKQEQKYNCKSTGSGQRVNARMVSNLTFDSLIFSLYTRAVADDEGVVKNGSAASYSIDKDKSTLGINHLVLFKNKSSTLLNININGASDGNFLNIMKSNKANYTFEASAKFSTRFSYATIYFFENNCEKLKTLRQTDLYPMLLAKYKEIFYTDTTALESIIKRKKDSLTNFVIRIDADHYTLSFYKNLQSTIVKMEDSLKKTRQVLHENLYALLNQEIAQFELKNKELLNGHSFRWLDYGLGYKLLGNNIFDSVLFKTNKVTQKQFHRLTATVAYNWLFNTKKKLMYINLGANFYNSYALEDLNKETFNFSDTLFIEQSFKGYNNITSQDINKNTFTFNPFVNFIYYFATEKKFGFEIASDIVFRKDVEIFNGRVGVVYSLIDPDDKDKARTTIGLFLSVKDYKQFDPKLGDYLGIGFRVGVPFNKLMKEKK